MKKIFYAFLPAVCLISILLLPSSFAENNFTITSVTSSDYTAGEELTISLDSYSDLTDYTTEVRFEGQTIETSDIGKNSIKGIWPKNLPNAGGKIILKYGSKEIYYIVKMPYIRQILMPDKIIKDREITLLGQNFDDCAVSISGGNLTVKTCNDTRIVLTIGSGFTGGDLTVTAYNFISKVQTIAFSAPEITFVNNENGIVTGGTLNIHGKGFNKIAQLNNIYIGSTKLEVLSIDTTMTILTVKLPEENLSGNLKIENEGIESNTISLKIVSPPILMGYKKDNNYIVLIGRNFSKNNSDNIVRFGTASASVTYSAEREIRVSIPSVINGECVSVEINNKKSNCTRYSTSRIPIITDYKIPAENKDDNVYEWILTGENFSEDTDDVEVYVNGSKVTVKKSLSKQITVQMTNAPEEGEVYAVVNGIKGETTRYDFGKFFYPSIRSVSAVIKFGSNREIIIEGNNFGYQRNADNVTLNLSKGKIATTENGIKDWNITPTKITVRLNDAYTEGDKINISVTARGKKSNDADFEMGSDQKQVKANPWIHNISYPEGAVMGKTARIRGRGFEPNRLSNHVYFDDKEVKVTKATEGLIDVIIPNNAKAGGKIQIKNGTRLSNTIDYISVKSSAKPFDIKFEKLDEATIETNTETVIGKLEISNILGNVIIRNMIMEIEYSGKDDMQYSVLPFSEIELSGGSSSIKPDIIRKDGKTYYVKFKDIAVEPESEPQSYDIKSTISPFASDGSKFRFKIDLNYVRAIHTDPQEIEVVKMDNKSVTGEWIYIDNDTETCVDTDSNEENCLNIATESPLEQTENETESSNNENENESTPSYEKRARTTLSQSWQNTGTPIVPFVDTDTNTNKEYIEELKKRGVVQGFGNNDFQPDKPVNRAEFLKMTVAGLQVAPGSIDTSVLDFTDVPKDAWFAPYVAWAVKYGVVQGYGDGSFKPGNNITRAEALKIILTAGVFNLDTMTHPFTDIDAWQHKYVAKALEKGILYAGTALTPNITINRSESARLITLMLRAYEAETD